MPTDVADPAAPVVRFAIGASDTTTPELVLREAASLRGLTSDTGGVVWTAAAPLARFVLADAAAATADGRSRGAGDNTGGLVVELGCGIGLVALAAAAAGYLRVLATDGDAATLRNVTEASRDRPEPQENRPRVKAPELIALAE